MFPFLFYFTEVAVTPSVKLNLKKMFVRKMPHRVVGWRCVVIDQVANPELIKELEIVPRDFFIRWLETRVVLDKVRFIGSCQKVRRASAATQLRSRCR
jgi:hypothetical protein